MLMDIEIRKVKMRRNNGHSNATGLFHLPMHLGVSFVSHFQVYIMGIERIKKGGEVVGPFSRVGGALLCIDQNH